MNLRDPQKYISTFWDWTPFNQCFGPTHVRIMDIDGAVERNGKFLFIETKLPGQPIPTGQKLFFDRLSRVPGFTVLVVWGQPNHPVAVQMWGRTAQIRTNAQQLADYIRRWFAWADRGGRQ